MRFGRPPGPQWVRPFVAALVGYLTFAIALAISVRYFEPELVRHQGSLFENIAADVIEGVGAAVFGLLAGLGLIFLGPAVLWARFQFWALQRFGFANPASSMVVGGLAGLAFGYAFYGLMLANLGSSGVDRNSIGPILAGCVAGALAGLVLCLALGRNPLTRRTSEP